jgi:hypothetical protein
VPAQFVAPRAAVASRRAALGGALVSLAAVASCDLAQSADQPGDAAGTPSGTASGGPTSTSSADPDTALVDRVLTELGELSGLVAAGSTYASLRTPLRALGELHAAHIEALDGERTAGEAPAVVFAGPADALRRVRAREQQGQRRLAGWAVAAESGALARLLASMSAGVAQHLVVLPPTGGADR